jgi:DUF4097 and DUF4098 domain-containing protein YvlB
MAHPYLRFPAALGALALLALPSAPLAAQRDGDRIDTTLTIERNGAVHLGLISGEIRVIGADRNDVRIVADIERGRFETLLSPTRIAVNTRSINNRQGSARYDVTVPYGTRVTASSVSGIIDVRATRGEVSARTTSGTIDIREATERVEANTVSGDIELRNVSGRLRMETTSGEIRVENGSGEVTAESVSGTISLRRSNFEQIRTQAMSGSISYDGNLAPTGTYRFNTHSGSVVLTVPDNVGAVLELETFSGRISTDFPLVLQPGEGVGRRNRRMEFTLGNGGARVIGGAFSGNITIRRRQATNNPE